MNKILICIVAVVCGLLEFSGSTNSYFEGRSGDIVLQPKNIEDDSFMIVKDGQNKFSLDGISEMGVADLLSYFLGGPVINPEASRESLPVEGSMFQKSRANALFVLDSVGSDLISKFPHLKMMSPEFGKNIKINKHIGCYPEDSLASVSTLICGKSPSVHGIVARQWENPFGVSMSAFRSRAVPVVSNLADIISQTFHGQSLVISASSDFQFASALGAHQYLLNQRPLWNNFALYLNNEEIDTVFPSDLAAGLKISTQKLYHSFLDRSFPLPGATDTILYEVASSEFLIHLNGENIHINLDISDRPILSFFAELEIVRTVVEQLQKDSNLNRLALDVSPDMFSFTFSSLHDILIKYGKDSQTFAASLYLLDGVLDEAITKLNSIYEGKLSVEIVMNGITAFTALQANEEIRSAVYSTAKYNLFNKESFDSSFPVLYLKKDVDLDQVCRNVKSVVDSYELEVTCNERMFLVTSGDTFTDAGNGTSTNGTSTNPEVSFQTGMWTGIILILIVFYCVYAVYTMDVGYDSLIYRATNLKHQHNL